MEETSNNTQEEIGTTVKNIKKERLEKNKKEKSKTRMKLVILFIVIFALISYVQLRGSYLEYKELGENFIDIFYTNIVYRYSIMAINFVFLYFIIYLINRGIKKGLKPFFEKENKQMPKLLNKSLALVISAIVSIVVSTVMVQKIMLVVNSTAFGIQDKVFNLDISYYVFQKPVIEMFALYFTALFIGLSIYMSIYYIVVFNMYFDGIEGEMLKNSLFMKKLTRNILFVIIGIAAITILNTQNMLFGKLLTVNSDIEVVGAGLTETTIKLWGYIIFAFVIIFFAYRAIKYFKEADTNKVIKNLAVIPGYLVILFVFMMIFDFVFVNSNELDKEKEYIGENIASTKRAYNISIDESNLQNSGSITEQEVEKNRNVIENIPIISKDAILKTVQDSQTETRIFFL